MKLVAIDFETANYSPLSACSLGLAIFQDQTLIESPYWLIKPPKGHGWFKEEWTKDIHGISWFDVREASLFGDIAPQVIAHLSGADHVIAHNAPFDLRILHALLEHFQFPIPNMNHRCTLELARKTWPHLPNHQLSTLAAHLGIELTHHNAESDAIAAGRLMLELGKSTL